MPLPAGLARFNRVVTNRLTRPLAHRLPWFGVLHHIGRRTGTLYDTPLNAWNDGESVIVALTYGDQVDWLANVKASDGATITMGGRTSGLGRPQVVAGDEGLSRMPTVVAAILAMIHVDRFVVFPIVRPNG
jgi:deazaflavin-dependent oxidoreductase (nitroreductase family)